MDVIILDVFLALVCCSDVGLDILDEITPSNTTDIRGFAMPVDKTTFTNILLGGFEVKHILANNSECVISEDRGAPVSTTASVYMEIVIRTVCIREYNSQHSVWIAGIPFTIFSFSTSLLEGKRHFPGNPLISLGFTRYFHLRGN